MTDLERLAAAHACERLVVQFHRLTNANQHLAVADLFADDGVWHQPVMGDLRGRGAVTSYLGGKLTDALTRHVMTNIAIDVIDADHATGIAYFTHYHAEAGAPDPAPTVNPMSVGRYDDRFVRTLPGWRFAYRRAELTFRATSFTTLPLYKDGRRLDLKRG